MTKEISDRTEEVWGGDYGLLYVDSISPSRKVTIPDNSPRNTCLYRSKNAPVEDWTKRVELEIAFGMIRE